MQAQIVLLPAGPTQIDPAGVPKALITRLLGQCAAPSIWIEGIVDHIPAGGLDAPAA